MTIIKEYCKNSSLHGLHYIVENERTILERIFWLCIFILSCYSCSYFIHKSLKSTNSISYSVTTNYLEWSTSYPAITICPNLNDRSVLNYLYPNIESTYKSSNVPTITALISAIILSVKVNFEFITSCPRYQSCPRDGYRDLFLKHSLNCSKVFVSCRWNKKLFDCCKYFKPFPVLLGQCLTINSYIIAKEEEHFPMIANNLLGPGEFQAELRVPSMLRLSSKTDSPSYEINEWPLSEGNFEILFSVIEWENDKRIISSTIEKRGCRFDWENVPGNDFPYYGVQSCLRACRIRYMIELCNCTFPNVPNLQNFPNGKYCDLVGLLCIKRNFENIFDRTNKKICTECKIESCTDPKIIFYKSQPTVLKMSFVNPNAKCLFRLKMSHLPSIRYKRSLVKMPLDLVVSIGGIVGLFLGASLLSFVEFIYFFTIRLFHQKYKLTKSLKKIPDSNSNFKSQHLLKNDLKYIGSFSK